MVDISGAYPSNAGVRRWLRTARAVVAGPDAARVVIEDDFELAAPAPVTLCYMTAFRPQADLGRTRAVLALSEAGASIAVSAANGSGAAPSLTADVEEIEVADARLSAVWGRRLYRTRITLGPLSAGTVTTTVTL